MSLDAFSEEATIDAKTTINFLDFIPLSSQGDTHMDQAFADIGGAYAIELLPVFSSMLEIRSDKVTPKQLGFNGVQYASPSSTRLVNRIKTEVMQP